MKWLILGVTISILAGETARSQEPTARDERTTAVEFPPPRVLNPGEPPPPAEVRFRKPPQARVERRVEVIERKLDSIPRDLEALKWDLRRASEERAATVPFPPARVLSPGEPLPPAEIRVPRPATEAIDERRVEQIEQKLDSILRDLEALKRDIRR